jgi:hypothetical protein
MYEKIANYSIHKIFFHQQNAAAYPAINYQQQMLDITTQLNGFNHWVMVDKD